MKKFAVMATLVCIVCPALSWAEMYKWVDDEGNVHYTQHPPTGEVKATEIAPPPDVNTEAAVKALQEDKKKLRELEESRQEAEEEQQQRVERTALYEKNCRLARQRLQALENTGRVRAIDEDGNMRRLTVEEHEARIAEVRKKVTKYCDGGGN